MQKAHTTIVPVKVVFGLRVQSKTGWSVSGFMMLRHSAY